MRSLTKPVLTSSARAWPRSLVAASDNAAAFHDLVSSGPLGAALAADGGSAAAALVSFVLVSDGGEGAPAEMRVVLALPDERDAAGWARVAALADAALATVDAVAAYKMAPEQRAKAVKVGGKGGWVVWWEGGREGGQGATPLPAWASGAAGS